MQDPWRFFKRFFAFLHSDSTNRVPKSQNFVKNLWESLRILENPWKVRQISLLLPWDSRDSENPEESSAIDAIINKRSRPRWLCEAHFYSVGGVDSKFVDEGCEDVHDALVLDSIYLFLSDSFIVAQLRVCCCCNIRRFFMFFHWLRR